MKSHRFRGDVFALIATTLCSVFLYSLSAPARALQVRGRPASTLPPGTFSDGTYSFEYFSGYEATTRVYRRYIVNNSPIDVRFDWPQVELGGKVSAKGGRLFHETPLEPPPSIAAGQLFYDYRRTRTTAYSFPPTTVLGKLRADLVSVLEGYVENAQGQLQRTIVKVTSTHAAGTFSYTISNASEVPIRILWADFARIWIQTPAYSGAYREEFASLVNQQAVDGQADDPTFVLNAGRTATWNLRSPREPREYFSRLEISTTRRTSPEFYGIASLYLPYIPT